LFKDEQFFFNEDDDSTPVHVNESSHPEDVVTVGDLIKCLRVNAKLDDKAMFRVNKAEAMLFDVHSKGGTTVIDIVPAKDARRMDEDVELSLDGRMPEDYITMGDLVKLGKQSYPHNATGWIIDNIVGIVDGKVIDFKDVKYARPETYPSNGIFYLLDGKPASYDAAKTEIGAVLSENSSNKKEDAVNEAITYEQWQEAAEWFDNNGYDLEDDEVRQE
jgi:hypothetical protein